MAIDPNISLTAEEVATLRQLCDKKGQLLPLAQAKLLYRIIQVLESAISSSEGSEINSPSEIINYLTQIVGLMSSGDPVPVTIASEQSPIPVSLSESASFTASESAIADSLAVTSAPISASAAMGFNGTSFDRIRSGVIAVGSPQGYCNSLACGVFNSIAPSMTNNRSVPLQVDGRGNLKATLVSGAREVFAQWTHYRSAVKVSDVVKTSGGNIYSLYAENLSSSLKWLLLFNSRNPPLPGSAPTEILPIKSSLLLGSDFWGLGGMSFGTGISWGISTSPSSFLAATAGDLYIGMRYL